MRIKSKWLDNETKSLEDIATALSFNTWRLIKNSLEDLINESFTIEKAQVFDVIAEFACFIIQCSDRLSAETLDDKSRKQLIALLIKQTALYYQENKSERIASGEHWRDFVALYNKRIKDYSAFGFTDAPDYNFYRYFATQIQRATTAADKKWIAQQIIEITAPKTVETLKRNLHNTLISVKNISNIKSKSQKAPTSRAIRRQQRRAKKGITKIIDINAKISAL